MAEYDYSEWLAELMGTTLFQDIEGGALIALLEAMQPRVVRLAAGDMFPPQFTPGHFMVFLREDAGQKPAPRRFKWDMPKRGEPGLLMGEIPSLSRFRDGMGGQELFTLKRKPLERACDLLELSGEMLTARYDEHVHAAQNTVLRNLLGILAQKVIDVRQDLFKVKYGVDIYNMQEGDKEKLTRGLMGG